MYMTVLTLSAVRLRRIDLVNIFLLASDILHDRFLVGQGRYDHECARYPLQSIKQLERR